MKKNFLIKIEPDANALFWNDNESDEDYGACIGDEKSLSIDGGRQIDLNIQGLSDWLSEYLWQVLAPCESGEMSLEELNKTFDWREYHKRGVAFAVQVKKLLPPNCVLKYSTPFEDKSGFIKEDLVIGDENWYVTEVLVKLLGTR